MARRAPPSQRARLAAERRKRKKKNIGTKYGKPQDKVDSELSSISLALDNEEYEQKSSEILKDEEMEREDDNVGDGGQASNEDGGIDSEGDDGADESNNIENNNVVRVGDVTNIDRQRNVAIILNGRNMDKSINVGPSSNPNDVVADNGAVNNQANNPDDEQEANRRADSTEVTSKRTGIRLEDFQFSSGCSSSYDANTNNEEEDVKSDSEIECVGVESPGKPDKVTIDGGEFNADDDGVQDILDLCLTVGSYGESPVSQQSPCLESSNVSTHGSRNKGTKGSNCRTIPKEVDTSNSCSNSFIGSTCSIPPRGTNRSKCREQRTDKEDEKDNTKSNSNGKARKVIIRVPRKGIQYHKEEMRKKALEHSQGKGGERIGSQNCSKRKGLDSSNVIISKVKESILQPKIIITYLHLYYVLYPNHHCKIPLFLI